MTGTDNDANQPHPLTSSDGLAFALVGFGSGLLALYIWEMLLAMAGVVVTPTLMVGAAICYLTVGAALFVAEADAREQLVQEVDSP